MASASEREWAGGGTRPKPPETPETTPKPPPNTPKQPKTTENTLPNTPKQPKTTETTPK
ncbi:nephronectin-like, partial [Strigops habroptila]|uniref:nephronectin-like n=1 Tax=Strigops habroptila TaxID=2489341 RepID=UPI0011CF85C2